VVRGFIIQHSADIDNDGHFELLKEGVSNSIPLAIPVSPIDSYGSAYRYCTWNPGAANLVDITYSQNNVAPPNAGMIGRIISAGTDKTFQTVYSDVSSKGDDILLEIYENSVDYTNAALGGWKDNGTYMSQLNPSDKIVTGSTVAPTHQLEIMGGNAAANGLAIGNVEIFNNVGNSAQINIPGGTLNLNGGGLQMSGVVFVDAAKNVSMTTLASTGNSTVGGTLAVTGTSLMTGALTANGGIGTTTLVTSGLTWDKLCHSRMAFPPVVALRGFPQVEMSQNTSERHSFL
jgi:hypothetical protein